MSKPRTLEERLLAPAQRELKARVSEPSQTLDVLEAVAARFGGWSLHEFRELVERQYTMSPDEALQISDGLPELILSSGIHHALALSSLARPDISQTDRRSTGAYYTDFRLAQYVAEGLTTLTPKSLLLDPACGTGILLAATVVAACGEDAQARGEMIRRYVCAADLDPNALAGARLALASLTSDLSAVEGLAPRLRQMDSLLEGPQGWSDIGPTGFDVVVGNPPWEKLKISRHEFLLSRGVHRHYGHDYQNRGTKDLTSARAALDEYATALARNYQLSEAGEPDLYRFFIELSAHLVKPTGEMGLLVPAGLIRSKSTEALRRALVTEAGQLRFTVLENRARFFSIDTRFKFLRVQAVFGTESETRLELIHAEGRGAEVKELGTAYISKPLLESLRPDLTVPEVRTDEEWMLFQRMSKNGVALGSPQSGWDLNIVREVDMTRDRSLMRRSARTGSLPLIEGRIVHQFRTGAKAYIKGTGRRAIWAPLPVGCSSIRPQFWVEPDALRDRRHEVARIGFCDITGQTNERTFLASMIPEHVVCGNKVPTIVLGSGQEGAYYLWLAIANSLPFDWLVRRVVTTTVNYFLLLGLPFPVGPVQTPQTHRLAALARQVSALDQAGKPADLWHVGELRAEIDVRVASLYGLEMEDIALITSDFPLLDRGQPTISGEHQSTITSDLLMSRAADFFGVRHDEASQRLELAREAGAVPYLPAQFAEARR